MPFPNLQVDGASPGFHERKETHRASIFRDAKRSLHVPPKHIHILSVDEKTYWLSLKTSQKWWGFPTNSQVFSTKKIIPIFLGLICWRQRRRLSSFLALGTTGIEKSHPGILRTTHQSTKDSKELIYFSSTNISFLVPVFNVWNRILKRFFGWLYLACSCPSPLQIWNFRTTAHRSFTGMDNSPSSSYPNTKNQRMTWILIPLAPRIGFVTHSWLLSKNPGVLLLMVQKSCVHQLRLVVYPAIYKVLYIPGGAGFLPSTVLYNLNLLITEILARHRWILVLRDSPGQ